MVTLADARIKVGRAREHLDDFERVFTEWFGSHPYEIVTERKVETGEVSVRLKKIEQPPARLSAILGDCVHNLRSALDHAVYGLASLSRPGESFTNIGFPVFADETRFDNNGRQTARHLTGPQRAFIKSLQPFLTDNTDARRSRLWVLNELDRIDKHRRLALLVVRTAEMKVGASHPWTVSSLGSGPLEDGAELMHGHSDHPEVKVDVELAVGPAIAEGLIFEKEQPVAPTMTRLGEVVEAILDAFERGHPYSL